MPSDEELLHRLVKQTLRERPSPPREKPPPPPEEAEVDPFVTDSPEATPEFIKQAIAAADRAVRRLGLDSPGSPADRPARRPKEPPTSPRPLKDPPYAKVMGLLGELVFLGGVSIAS